MPIHTSSFVPFPSRHFSAPKKLRADFHVRMGKPETSCFARRRLETLHISILRRRYPHGVRQLHVKKVFVFVKKVDDKITCACLCSTPNIYVSTPTHLDSSPHMTSAQIVASRRSLLYYELKKK